MITFWGGQISRSIQAVWVVDEMGLPYHIRRMDMLAAKKNLAWLAINIGVSLSAIQDGEVTMVQSVTIVGYLMSRYGHTPLHPSPCDPAFTAYQQFLHLGEPRSVLGEAEKACLSRTSARDAFKRAFDRSHDGVAA